MTALRPLPDDLPCVTWRRHTLLLVGVAAVILLTAVFVKPIQQPLSYHAFHDGRAFLGIPNFLNVVSNLPFLAIGLMGLRWLQLKPADLAPELRAPYAVVFAGLAATAFGSAYYHWAPDNHTLVWDRLPIAVSFMALFAAVLAERVTIKAARLLWPLALFGGATVAYWYLVDDLRPYLIAQFLPVLLMPLILWLYPARYGRGLDFQISIGFYALAKALEFLDGPVYAGLGYGLSGHTLKHFAAAGGAWWIYRMLVLRKRC